MKLTPEQEKLNKSYVRFKRKFCKGMSMVTHDDLAECYAKWKARLTKEQQKLLPR